MPEELVNVRYMVDDVDTAVAFYTTHFGFELRSSAAPAFADVTRGRLRLLLSGPASSAGRPMPDGRTPQPGGWNRIHLIVDDLTGDVERLRAAGLRLPQRHRQRPGRPADPDRRPRRQPDRALPIRRLTRTRRRMKSAGRSALSDGCRRFALSARPMRRLLAGDAHDAARCATSRPSDVRNAGSRCSRRSATTGTSGSGRASASS